MKLYLRSRRKNSLVTVDLNIVFAVTKYWFDIINFMEKSLYVFYIKNVFILKNNKNVFNMKSQLCLSNTIHYLQVENLFRVYRDKRTMKIAARRSLRDGRPSPDTSHPPSQEATPVPSECDTG